MFFQVSILSPSNALSNSHSSLLNVNIPKFDYKVSFGGFKRYFYSIWTIGYNTTENTMFYPYNVVKKKPNSLGKRTDTWFRQRDRNFDFQIRKQDSQPVSQLDTQTPTRIVVVSVKRIL